MSPPTGPPAALAIEPPLDEGARQVLGELAGRPDGPVRIWRDQPRQRSPWSASPCGSRLLLDPTGHEHAAAWLRFLLAEVLSPRSAAARARSSAVGLTPPYDVSGRVELIGATDGPAVLVVGGRRVREVGWARSRGPVGRGGGSAS